MTESNNIYINCEGGNNDIKNDYLFNIYVENYSGKEQSIHLFNFSDIPNLHNRCYFFDSWLYVTKNRTGVTVKRRSLDVVQQFNDDPYIYGTVELYTPLSATDETNLYNLITFPNNNQQREDEVILKVKDVTLQYYSRLHYIDPSCRKFYF